MHNIRFLIFTLLISAVNAAYTQTTNQLDQKYGFRHFVFNTSPSKYDGELIEAETWDKNPKIKVYKYVGDQIPAFMGTPITDMDLTFYQSKLYSISVSFGDVRTISFKEDDYEKVLSLLQSLYGQGDPINMTKPTGKMKILSGRKWVGNKVELEVIRYHYESTTTDQGYIVLSEKSMLQSRRRDEF